MLTLAIIGAILAPGAIELSEVVEEDAVDVLALPRHLQEDSPTPSPSPSPSAEDAPLAPSLVTVSAGGFPSEISWELACEGAAPILGGAPYYASHAVPEGMCALTMLDSYGDGWNHAECAPQRKGSNTEQL